MKLPIVLSLLLVVVMAAQAMLGIAFPEYYRDVAWIRAAWFGNDHVTLFLAVPLLIGAIHFARRGSMRGTLFWLGMLGYGVYNYAYYALGAALNGFLPLYLAALLLSAIALILGLVRLPVQAVAAGFSPKTPVKSVGGYLVFIAFGLSAVWLVMWYAFIVVGAALPFESEAFRLVAVLDIVLMAPVLGIGGVLLWRRQAWGYVLASVAGIQGALYLLVLTVNSGVFIANGLAEAPGEIPVWAPLATATGVMTGLLMFHVNGTVGASGQET